MPRRELEFEKVWGPYPNYDDIARFEYGNVSGVIRLRAFGFSLIGQTPATLTETASRRTGN